MSHPAPQPALLPPVAARPSPPGPVVLLLDNGSLAPAATLALRELAARLATACGRDVRPVSLLHSSAIDPANLGGRPAEILEPALRRLAEAGVLDVLIVPLFAGPSGALTEYIPERVRHLREKWPALRVCLAPCVVNAARADDTRVAAMLADHARAAAKAAGFSRPAVAVVDHGSPQREVYAVRELVAAQTRSMLGPFARAVVACSMERRSGAAYDFNEPLLSALLDTPDFSAGEVIVAPLFFLPGRHAGPGGDLAQIGAAAQVRHPGVKIALAEPLGAHPALAPLLKERLGEGLQREVMR